LQTLFNLFAEERAVIRHLRQFLALVCTLTALPLAARAAAGPDDWQLLGSRRVSFSAEKDVIEVGVREGLFNAIRVEVQDGDLEMYNIRVVFGNGTAWSPDTRVAFRERSRSRVIDLPGEARVIRRIEFWYRSRLRRGQATVQVLGRQVHPAHGDQAGWDEIGVQQVDFRADHDVIRPTGRGRFRRIRFVVEGGDIEMFNIRVTLGDGERFSPPTRLHFGEHSRSRDIDLPGAARIIRRIDFFYRSVRVRGRGRGQGRATVRVYGHR
jgi:hypothetical protein